MRYQRGYQLLVCALGLVVLVGLAITDRTTYAETIGFQARLDALVEPILPEPSSSTVLRKPLAGPAPSFWWGLLPYAGVTALGGLALFAIAQLAYREPALQSIAAWIATRRSGRRVVASPAPSRPVADRSILLAPKPPAQGPNDHAIPLARWVSPLAIVRPVGSGQLFRAGTYPSHINKAGTFTTDAKAVAEVINLIPAGAGRVSISSYGPRRPETAPGLRTNLLEAKNVIPIVTDAPSGAPVRAAKGDPLFQGLGKDVPRGGPKALIDSLSVRGGTKITQGAWKGGNGGGFVFGRGSIVERSAVGAGGEWIRYSDGSAEVIFPRGVQTPTLDFPTGDHQNIRTIEPNGDGTYTVTYASGQSEVVNQPFLPTPGNYRGGTLCLTLVCYGETKTDSDGTRQPHLGVTLGPLPISYAYDPGGPYNGDPRSLQGVKVSAELGVGWIGGPGYDLTTGLATSPLPRWGTPQLGVTVTAPLPLLSGPKTPRSVNSNYQSLFTRGR